MGLTIQRLGSVEPKVETQLVDGKPCYFLIATSPFKIAFWIDKKTFLLDQMATNVRMGSIHLKSLQTITSGHIDPSLTATNFSVPAH